MFGHDRQLHARVQTLEREVRRLEALVTGLSRRAGLAPHELAELREQTRPGIIPEIRALVEQGELIRAIKAYREETGAGLKEAKDAIDALAEGRG